MAHQHTATVHWRREGQLFTDGRYSRAHEWRFDGGTVVQASSAPSSVRLPYSREDAVDPEEALVAALSSCHMLFFLSLAQRQGVCVDDYRDEAEGIMSPNENGKLFLSSVLLKPSITFSGEKRPGPDEVAHLHHRAHEECFIANSVLTRVEIAAVAPLYA